MNSVSHIASSFILAVNKCPAAPTGELASERSVALQALSKHRNQKNEVPEIRCINESYANAF
jgi:hypothetical protein